MVAASCAASVLAIVQVGRERASRRDDAARSSRALVAAQARIGALEARVQTLSARLTRDEQRAASGLAPLAARILKSVFTVEVGDRSGSGWAAWADGSDTIVVTAAHVVEGAERAVLRRKNAEWNATVVGRDGVSDLAILRVKGHLAAPLWPRPEQGPAPRVGDSLVLVGSPYGLEGTVTTGIVSRITYREIQTDAAANPGNSGGPAVDRKGRVVGVLLAGGGENLNFTVPVRRLCVRLRSC